MTYPNRPYEVLDAIRAFVCVRGHSPSYRDIMDLTGIGNPSLVKRYVEILAREGSIRRTPGLFRAIELLGSYSVEKVMRSAYAQKLLGTTQDKKERKSHDRAAAAKKGKAKHHAKEAALWARIEALGLAEDARRGAETPATTDVIHDFRFHARCLHASKIG